MSAAPERMIARLNEAQRKAATTVDGPLLIIAGPGSGKTHTLVERIVHLITAHDVQPEEILVSTFTEKAAAELITRVSSRLAALDVRVNLNEMYIGTLHSLCLRILDDHREHTRLKRSYSVMDQFDQQYLTYRRLKLYDKIDGSELVLGPPEQGSWRRAETLVTWVNKLNEELIEPSALLEGDDERLRALGRLFEDYMAWMERENLLDFSAIQVETWRLLERHPEVLEKLQARLRYLMVDEYQDTNTVQEAILLKLSGSHTNLCVVGDDDQGLYRFRGATIRNILEFPAQVPGECAKVELTTNYRSHPRIIDFFGAWMNDLDWLDGSRSFRHNKRIVPREDDFWPGSSVIRVGSEGGDDAWHEEVLAFLTHLRETGRITDWNQVACLFRSVKNRRAVELARYLEANGVPVYSPRSNLFFEREEVVLAVGALIFLFPQFEEVIKSRWPKNAREPAIWSWYEQCLSLFVATLREPEQADLLKWCRYRARDHATLRRPTDYAFSGLFYQLLQFPLFSRYLGEDAHGGVRDSRPARNLALLSKLLTRFEYFHRVPVLAPKYLDANLRQLFNNYFRFLESGGLDEFEDASEYAPSGCISFMTIHQAKGLEFPVVMVGSLEAVPRKQYTELDEILQENFYTKDPFEPIERIKYFDFWRLYYTAFSRAQNLLVLMTAERYKGHGQAPSRYFHDLYQALPTWRAAQESLSEIALAEVKSTDLKARYSFTSHITVYENCPRQYKFFKDLGFTPVRSGAILFGTLVHQTIEDVHKAAIRQEPELIAPRQIETWLRSNYRQLAARERRYLPEHSLKSALKQVLGYVEHVKVVYGGWRHIQEAEVDVSLVQEGYILEGSVDLIQGVSDTVEVVDFKGEKKPDLEADRDRVRHYRRQLEVYGYLIEQRLGKKVSKLHIHYTGESHGNPRITFPMSAPSVQATIEAFDATVREIENKNYALTARPEKLCVNCDMKHYCDRK